MRRTLILIFILAGFGKISAQTSASIVKWKCTLEEESGKKYIRLDAEIKDSWHLYSQFLDGDGPVPTTFTFDENKNIELVGKMQEGKAHSAYDPNFDMIISYFEGKTTFKQEIKILSKTKQKISGSVEFMVCDDHQCYPPESVPFSVELN